MVAVPSRLYALKDDKKPLAGKRFAVKDNYRIANIRTTQSSRAFVATYGPETETAHFVQSLISLGAVIVGKTRMSAFASSQEPTDQWLDFHAPCNPRGDGYQTPAEVQTGQPPLCQGTLGLIFQLGQTVSGPGRIQY